MIFGLINVDHMGAKILKRYVFHNSYTDAVSLWYFPSTSVFQPFLGVFFFSIFLDIFIFG